MHRTILVFVAATALAACTTVGGANDRKSDVKVVAKDAISAPTVSAGEFVDLVRAAGQTGGPRAIDRVVTLFPDLALDASGIPSIAAEAVAASYDRVWGTGSAEPRRAARTPPTAGPDLLVSAREQAQRGARHAALVLCSAHELDAAQWQDAVRLGGDVRDPRAWERLLDARPGGAAWPADAAFPGEAELRERIVAWRLDRGELTWATFAALRAEAAADGDTRVRLRLSRARALALSQRSGEALLLLAAIGDGTSPALQAEALALTALVQAERDDLPAAIEHFERALQTAPDWPGRGRVLADFAIALLRNGDQSRGTAMLAEAEHCCEQQQDRDGLVRTLRNEAIVARGKGDGATATTLEQRATDLVRTNGLLTDAWSTR